MAVKQREDVCESFVSMCHPSLCINSRSDRCPTDVQSLRKTDYDVILKSNPPPPHKINTIKVVST